MELPVPDSGACARGPGLNVDPRERQKPRLSGAFVDAPKRTRTSTRCDPDQALNLARLPIPPSARASGQYRARPPPADLCPSTARATVHEHMFDWLPTKRGLAWT